MAINKRIIKSNEGGAAVATSFNTVLYTGNSSTQSITGVGFQPDFVWIKKRTVFSHALFDSLRGATKRLFSDLTNAEDVAPSYLSSFNTDGFTLGGSIAVNESSQPYVAWCWKAGGAAVTNTDGTITSQVSANVEAGFSIVKYTATGGGNYSVGHGLSQTPDFVIVKPTTENVGWTIWSSTFPNLTNSYINFTTMAVNTAGTVWGSGMTSTVIGQTSGATSNPNQSLIAYCFAEVAGFSKFGSHTGNGGTKSIDVGFEPAFVISKITSSVDNWRIYDNKRSPFGQLQDEVLLANGSQAEFVNDPQYIEFTSTGFNLFNNANNLSGETYIYMAFANQF